MSKQYPGGLITKTPVVPTQVAASGVWTLDQQAYWQKLGQWPAPPYQISRSLRFNGADSTKLTRTPSSSTSSTLGTFSFWTKLGPLVSGSNNGTFISAADSYAYGQFYQNTLYFGNTTNYLNTTAVFRDFSAWYHIVFVFDTTQATSTNRLKIYVNGVLQIAGSLASYPTQNASFPFLNGTQQYQIGGNGLGSSVEYYNGYMTEINFIDGQALTPSSFGYTEPATGVWTPYVYTGSYGTNGFYLNFSDNSNTTAATLGKDNSGNGNNWTPNNFSVTAGAGNDSLVDSPTSYGTDTGAGGTVRGNYCTLNPLSNTSGTWSNGNLQFVGPNDWRRSNSTIAVSTGQWYWEVTLGNAPYSPRNSSSDYNAFGFGLSTSFGSATNPGTQTDALVLRDNGYYKNFSGASTNGGVTLLSGDVLSIAVDLDANTFTFRVNNTSLVTGTIGGTVGRELTPIFISFDGTYGVMYANFGQRPFAYTAPSGYKALCTQNLPTPTIGAASATLANKYFNAIAYSGNGSQSVTGVGFQPDWVWVKSRSSAVYNHQLHDAVRGATAGALFSNLTSAQDNLYQFDSFDSDGFTTDASNIVGINNSGETFVAWNWKANGAGVSNTAGSITSTVSANTTSGFSVVTYTGTGANATVGHGLGVAPKFIITKKRSSTSNWATNDPSQSNPFSGALLLNSTNAFVSSTAVWNDTAPTSTVFTIGTADATNISSATYVAYCFAPIAGFSAFGSYTGNSSTDGTFVYLGFRPAYMMIKASNAIEDWAIMDVARSPYNGVNLWLNAEDTSADATLTPPQFDFNSNGMKLRGTSSTVNATGTTYIYMAFASNPFKTSLAR